MVKILSIFVAFSENVKFKKQFYRTVKILYFCIGWVAILMTPLTDSITTLSSWVFFLCLFALVCVPFSLEVHVHVGVEVFVHLYQIAPVACLEVTWYIMVYLVCVPQVWRLVINTGCRGGIAIMGVDCARGLCILAAQMISWSEWSNPSGLFAEGLQVSFSVCARP